jgi:hypothetical protein
MAVARDSRPRTLRDAVRVSNRYVLNPVMLRLAGRKHWYGPVENPPASVVAPHEQRQAPCCATPNTCTNTPAAAFLHPFPADPHRSHYRDRRQHQAITRDLLDAISIYHAGETATPHARAPQ